MTQKLGIAVTTRNSFPHVLGLTRAAREEGKETEVFITGDGVFQTQEKEFPEIVANARVGICEVSYINRGFAGVAIDGLNDKDFVTQGRNAEMVDECDRYIIL